MSNFRINCSKVHLTYKTHIPLEKWQELLKKLPEPILWSFVHELGHTDDDEKPNERPASDDTDNKIPEDIDAYEHTHIFYWGAKNIDTINPRFFDIDEIHPHIAKRTSMAWAKLVVTKYHHGIKSKSKKVEPVFLKQFKCQDWMFDSIQWDLSEKLPTVRESCLEIGIVPKSIADVEAARRLSRKRGFTELAEGVDPDKFKHIAWDRTKALILRGDSNAGKTQWAICQFKNAFKIEDLDELKELPEGTDGIIFDEQLFDKCPKKTMICLLDYEMPRSVRIRHILAHIPAGMQRIFTCNEHEHPFGDNPATGGHKSVTSRYRLIDVKNGDLTHEPLPER